MSKERNPQAEQMADESMVRGLAAQANAIWPQEELFLARYALSPDARIADIGCGSGEITARLAGLFPRAYIVGIDILAELRSPMRASATLHWRRAFTSSRAMRSSCDCRPTRSTSLRADT